MPSYLIGRDGHILWETLAILVFAAVFFIVGVFRVVEFQGVGLGKITKPILIIFHLIGCALLTFALGLLDLDPYRIYRSAMTIIFFSAIGTLFPIHIYVAIKRRIRIKDLGSSPHL